MASPKTRLVVCLLVLGGCAGWALSHLQTWDTPAPAVSAPPSAPKSHTEDLALGPSREATRRLQAGGVHRYSFDLRAGEILEAVVDQDVLPKDEVDVVVLLFGPSGAKLYEIDSPTEKAGSEEIFLLAEATGTYRAAITAGGMAGTYRMRRVSIHPASTTDRVHARAEELFYLGREFSKQSPPAVEKAVTNLLEAERLWRVLGYPKKQAAALYRAGELLYYKSGEMEKARTLLERALVINRALGDREEEIRTLNLVGLTNWRIDGVGAAERCFRTALQTSLETGNPEGEALSRTNLAGVLSQRGKVWEALDNYERALPIWQERGRQDNMIHVLSGIGVIYGTLGDFQNALRRIESASRLTAGMADPQARAIALSRIADLFIKVGNPSVALPYYQRALIARKQAGDLRGEGVNLTGIGLTFRALHDFRRARASIEQALAIFRQVQDQQGEVAAYVDLGQIFLEQKEAERAFEYAQRAREISEDIRYRQGSIQALYIMALADRVRGNSTAARKWVEQALDLIESMHEDASREDLKASYLDQARSSYDLLIDLLLSPLDAGARREDVARAFEASEKVRWRSLLDSLRSIEPHYRQEQPADPHLFEERRKLEEELRKNENERRRLVRDRLPHAGVDRLQAVLIDNLRTVETKMRLTDTWSTKAGHPTPITLHETQALLDRDTILLEYHLGERRSFLWRVTASEIDWFPLPPRAAIEAKATRFYDALVESQPDVGADQTNALARDLATLLLGPVADRLDAKRLVVVPDGTMHLVPFSLLPSPGAWLPLIQDHEVVNLPSVSVLAAIRKETYRRETPSGLIAAIADPAFSPGGLFSKLANSREEARRILALVPEGERSLAAFGVDANLDLVTSGRLSEFRILHFATHGLIHSAHPELSSLALSQVDREGRQRDGDLSFSEIQKLYLPADLVVLSACKTALGSKIKGEGPVGLTHAFMRAGAATVLVSLWNVDDESTPAFMEHFYRALLIEKRPPIEALRATQLWMASQPRWRSPYYWAGFVLQGEWR